jgi:hypothetical protein
MARTFDPNSLISLPRVDANQAVVLAQQLEAATLDETGKPRDLPEAIQEAIDDVKTGRAALQDALGAAPEPEDMRAIDKLEDNAIAALVLILAGWSRVKGQLDLGDMAAEVGKRLGVEEGLGFINIRSRDEYGIVDTKLKTIVRESLEDKLGNLGLSPLLGHLREVHERYGAALGMTRALPAEERGLVRARYDALLESMRHYAGAVMGSRQRKKPATTQLADSLLLPLANWKSDPVQKVTKEGSETPAPA